MLTGQDYARGRARVACECVERPGVGLACGVQDWPLRALQGCTVGVDLGPGVVARFRGGFESLRNPGLIAGWTRCRGLVVVTRWNGPCVR